jgi:hypothetical protein
MGIYTNSKCPACGYSYSRGYQKIGTESKLGLPFLRCPNCMSIAKTGKKIYSMMNNEEKSDYILTRMVQMLINAFGISIGLLALAIWVGIIDQDKMQTYPDYIIVGTLALFLSSILSYSHDRKIIKTLEKAYKEKDPDYYADY